MPYSYENVDNAGAFSKMDMAEHSFQVYLDTMKGVRNGRFSARPAAVGLGLHPCFPDGLICCTCTC